MPLSLIEISQDNIYNDSDLMPVHSTLVFLVDVTYSGSIPEYIYCDVYNEDSELLGTFKCIPNRDKTLTKREFAFVADEVLRGFMNSYDDFVQSDYSFVSVPDITKFFTLTFRDPGAIASSVSQEIMAVHGAAQFGSNPNLDTVYNNETDTYYTAEGQPIYIYFYNNDATNTVTVEDQSLQTVYAVDYLVENYADASGNLYTINVII